MAYEPQQLPFTDDLMVLVGALQRELQDIAASMSVTDNLQLPELHAEPDKPRLGMIVLADGSDWNPGSGAGYYGRLTSSWVFLG